MTQTTMILGDSVEQVTRLRMAMQQEKVPVTTQLTPLEWDVAGYCRTCLVTSAPRSYVNALILMKKAECSGPFEVMDAPEAYRSEAQNVVRYLPKIRAIIERLKTVYQNEDDARTWVVTSSYGKDSTLAAALIWVAVNELPPEKRTRRVLLITSDTGVEPPDAKAYQRRAMAYITEAAKKEHMPMEAHMVQPPIRERFAVKVIGRGVKPSNSKGATRGCTFWWKIDPIDRFLAELGEDVIVFLGVRSDESQKRKESIDFYQKDFVFPKEDREGKRIEGQDMCHPISDVTQAELWDTLAQHPVLPWGMPLDELLVHYQDSAECPMQVGKQNPNSCGNSRNGCTICQMVEDDKMLEAFDGVKDWAHAAIQFRTLLRNLMFDQKMRKYPSYFRKHTDRYNPFLGTRQEMAKWKKRQREEAEQAFAFGAMPLDGHSTPFYPDNEPGALHLKARIKLLKAALYWQKKHPELAYVSDEELALIKAQWKEEWGWEENEEDLAPKADTHEEEALVLRADFTVNTDRRGGTAIPNLVLPEEYNHTRANRAAGAVKGDARILNPDPDMPMRYLHYVHRDVSGNEQSMYDRIGRAEAQTGLVLPYFFNNGWRFEGDKRVYWNVVTFVVCEAGVRTFAQACDLVDDFLHAGSEKHETPDWGALWGEHHHEQRSESV